MMRLYFILIAVLNCLSAHAATLVSDGSRADVQSKINSAVDGDTVTIPAGSFTWTTPVTISGKGITLSGGGAGLTQAYSKTSTTIGTGSKTFSIHELAPGQTLAVGMSVQAWHGMNINNSMLGTVTAWNGSNSLTINVTNATGSATTYPWIIRQRGTTGIGNGLTSGNTGVIAITPDASHSTIIEGISFSDAATAGDRYHISGSGTAAHYTIIRRCRFITSGNLARSITWANNALLVHNTTFDCTSQDDGSIGIYGNTAFGNTSWSTLSTMGTNDVGMTSNVYVEDCAFNFHAIQGIDSDNGGRMVFRKNTFYCSTIGGHGTDTSTHGNRHVEAYQNRFVFVDGGNGNTPSLARYYRLRGGTGLMASNYVENITSQAQGDQAEAKFEIYALGEGYSGIGLGCIHTNNQSVYPASTYPAIRQIGFGRVTGSGTTNATWGYYGDREPVYIWGNSNYTPTIGFGSGNLVCSNRDQPGAFIQIDSDADGVEEGEVITGYAKPGWVAAAYPHPLNDSSGADTSPPTTPTLSVGAVSSTTAYLSWTASTDNVGVAAYDVYRSGVLLYSTGSTFTTETGLTPSTSYSYTVRARDASGNSSVDSNTGSFTTTSPVTSNTGPKRKPKSGAFRF